MKWMVWCGVTAALAGCDDSAQRAAAEQQIDGARVVIDAESEILSRPVDLAIDTLGQLYVLDQLLAQVIVLSPAGERLRVIGNEGSGPGEFRRPRVLTLMADTLLVADMGNDRLQTLALNSDHVQTVSLPPGADMGDVAVDTDGSVFVSTLGRENRLAERYDPTGTLIGGLGVPPAPVVSMLDFRRIKEEILDGTVPDLFRNTVRPVFASGGGAWLILNGEGRVERYDAQDSLQWAVSLDAPELERIWLDVVERNREMLNDPRRLSGLAYVADAAAIGDTLWLLLNQPSMPAVMLSVSGARGIDRRLHFTDVVGAQRFAIDHQSDTIYFTVPSEARIVAALWPEDSP